jgi:hypothetical protein
MNYLHTSRVAWVASSERLASGGDHLCTDGLLAATATSTLSGSLAEATTSTPTARQRRWRPPLLRAACQRRRPPLHRRLASGGNHLCAGQPPNGGDHLSVRAMAKRPSPPPSYRVEDKTIQAMELGAQRQAVLAVWLGPRTRSSPPSQGW